MTIRRQKEFTEQITAQCLDKECNKIFKDGAVHPNAKRHHKATGHKVVVQKLFVYRKDD